MSTLIIKLSAEIKDKRKVATTPENNQIFRRVSRLRENTFEPIIAVTAMDTKKTPNSARLWVEGTVKLIMLVKTTEVSRYQTKVLSTIKKVGTVSFRNILALIVLIEFIQYSNVIM